jgi:choice-of-anchor B domain-containing protein
MIQVFENDTTSIDHNIYTKGDYAYASNYTSGLRVYDTRDVAGEGLREVAFFDLYPENENASFEGGTWSNYPYFRQKGVVAASSIDRGLFILQPRVGRAGS